VLLCHAVVPNVAIRALSNAILHIAMPTEGPRRKCDIYSQQSVDANTKGEINMFLVAVYSENKILVLT
jgi:hypothetical protein